MAKRKNLVSGGKNPKPNKMGPVKKGALTGATVGLIAALGLRHQAIVREGHAGLNEAHIRSIKHELERLRKAPPELRRVMERNRRLSGEPPLGIQLNRAKKALGPRIKDERARAKTLRSASKYPLPAGLALGTGVGALSALRKKRRARKTRRRPSKKKA